MTREEVKKILGNPRSVDYENYNYGNVWIIFEGGIVRCLVIVEDYSSTATCGITYQDKKIK